MTIRFCRTGFTLIELCITLVVFALLAGLAVPAFSGTMSRARIDAALSRLAGDIHLARALAARRGVPLRIRFIPDDACAERYEVVTDDGVVLRTATMAGAGGICLTSNVRRAMRVNARGMLMGAQRTVRVTAGDEADSATISIVGRVYRWD